MLSPTAGKGLQTKENSLRGTSQESMKDTQKSMKEIINLPRGPQIKNIEQEMAKLKNKGLRNRGDK